jgi:adenosylmethionine-8-amino-7-oxononanoate aminotransferase
VACAAAVAVADAFKEEKILDNVNARYSLYFSEITAESKGCFACIEICRAIPGIKGNES